MAMPSVLVVEDEWLLADYFAAILEHLGYDVCGIAGDAEGAVALARRHAPDVVLMDLRLAGQRDGVDAACAIEATLPVSVIFVTASGDPRTMQRIRTNDPDDILVKPVLERDLATSLGRLCPLPGAAEGGHTAGP